MGAERRRAEPHRRVVRTGLSEQVYQVLKSDIINEKVPPGERIVIDELARQMGVSATPIREALARLAAEQLVSAEPYVGYTIQPKPSQEEVAQLFVVREAIEGCAARLAAKWISDAEISRLETINERIISRTYGADAYADYAAFVVDNQEFHEALVRASGNAPLLRAFRGMNYDALTARATRGRGIPDVRDNYEEHIAIIAALRGRDPGQVERAVRAHIRRGARRMLGDAAADAARA
ncbi:MAG: GntR family transcriptional regulator [Thermoleophilia bacterium]|nr:GntR family transcriptional regulator [Thermoleophilia bacterium]